MDISKLRDIFIEESNEIIEKLDVDIINFEENPEDKELLNELFRGVHTLKGSANSFGFIRLGEFVHHFEDALDYYRNSNKTITVEVIDIFLDAVDVIKEVMLVEIDGTEDLPNDYNKSLEAIKSLLDENKKDQTPPSPISNDSVDLGEEFDFEIKDRSTKRVNLEELSNKILDCETLYKITLNLDEDIYFRGFDHAKLFFLLSKDSHIL